MAKIKITDEIIEALKRAIEERVGGDSELSRDTGVNQPTINMIKNRKTTAMTCATWERLLPVLAKHLPSNYVQNSFNRNSGSIRITTDRAISTRDAVESFRSEIISSLIDLDIDPDALAKVLRAIKAVRYV